MNGPWAWSCIVFVTLLVASAFINRYYSKSGKPQREQEAAEEASVNCSLEERSVQFVQTLVQDRRYSVRRKVMFCYPGLSQ